MHRIKFLRHAEGEHMKNSKTHVVGRQAGAPLTPVGCEQSHLKGAEFKRRDYWPDRVHSSSSLRCTQTTDGILQGLGLSTSYEVSDLLLELDHGEVTGMPRDEVYTAEITEKIELLGKDFKQPGGESMNEVGARGVEYLKFLTDVFEEEDHLVVAHGGLISCTVSALYGWNGETTRNLQLAIPVVGEVDLVYDKGDWTVDSAWLPESI